MGSETAPVVPKILVIDDEQGMRDLLSYELGSRGYTVTAAMNGEEGVDIIRREKFNVVVSDVKMPKMGGVEVLNTVKKIHPDIEVIMTTGFGTIDLAVQCIQNGAYDFLTKPYNIEELCTRVDKAIEKQRLSTEVTTLKELSRLKSEFLANTSHELRTPLNAIIGYTSLILDRLYGDYTEKQSKALRRINANANNLLQLINNILDISKLSAGKMPLYLEDFKIQELLQEVVEMMDALAREKNLVLEMSCDPEITLYSDKTRLKQIIINLISNAIKFTHQGSVRVEASYDSGTPQAPGFMKIQVKDTGIGIKPEHMETIFEEFRQADASTTREYGGTGLGLAIVKKLAGLLEGSVQVQSELNKGSLFTVTIPCKPKPPEEKPGEFQPSQPGIPQASPISQENHNVFLAIDDDPEVLRLIKDSLQNSGYVFMGAQSGEEGIALARRIKPFAITLDILMPHKDGWSVLQALKSDPETWSIPVIILSIMENKSLGFALGVSDYIIKPFDRRVLLERLNHLAEIKDKKVLIVDDDRELNSFLQILLRNEGYQVAWALDGVSAVKAIEEHHPDLMLLDLSMPKVSGFDVLEKIQSNPSWEDMRVIIMTGMSLSEEENAELRKRAEMIIEKGSRSLKDILALIKKRLDQARVAH